MNDRELTTLLKTIKDAPEFGGGFSVEQLDKGYARLMREIGHEEAQATAVSPEYTIKDFVQYATWWLNHVFVRPLAVGFTAFSIIFGSWIFTVNASFDTIPGDVLYPVKLAAERVQLTFATSNTTRARLHTEFAGRRLAEAVEISESDREGKDVLLRAAVESFKSELVSANETLQQVSPDNAAEAVTIAEAVDIKFGEYQAVIDQTQIGEVTLETEGVEAVQDIVDEANQAVAEEIVSAHEVTPQSETEQYLLTTFQSDFMSIRDRLNLNRGRLEVIKSVLATYDLEGEKEYLKQIESISGELVGFETTLAETMDIYAAGGYRRVMEMVSGLNGTLNEAEATIVELEIAISTSVSSLMAASEPAAPSVATDAPTF